MQWKSFHYQLLYAIYDRYSKRGKKKASSCGVHFGWARTREQVVRILPDNPPPWWFATRRRRHPRSLHGRERGREPPPAQLRPHSAGGERERERSRTRRPRLSLRKFAPASFRYHVSAATYSLYLKPYFPPTTPAATSPIILVFLSPPSLGFLGAPRASGQTGKWRFPPSSNPLPPSPPLSRVPHPSTSPLPPPGSRLLSRPLFSLQRWERRARTASILELGLFLRTDELASCHRASGFFLSFLFWLSYLFDYRWRINMHAYARHQICSPSFSCPIQHLKC